MAITNSVHAFNEKIAEFTTKNPRLISAVVVAGIVAAVALAIFTGIPSLTAIGALLASVGIYALVVSVRHLKQSEWQLRNEQLEITQPLLERINILEVHQEARGAEYLTNLEELQRQLVMVSQDADYYIALGTDQANDLSRPVIEKLQTTVQELEEANKGLAFSNGGFERQMAPPKTNFVLETAEEKRDKRLARFATEKK